MVNEPTIPCELCSEPTNMLGTKRCNRCWELERRIEHDPELARTILERLCEPVVVCSGQGFSPFEIPGYDDPNPTRDKIRKWAEQAADRAVRQPLTKPVKIADYGRCCPTCYRPVHDGPCR